eukprot:403373388
MTDKPTQDICNSLGETKDSPYIDREYNYEDYQKSVNYDLDADKSTHLQPLMSSPQKPKQILWGSAICASVLWGGSNFTFGFLDNQDFAVSCLSWTGFLTVSFIYKVYELSRHRVVTKEIFVNSLVGDLKNKENLVHMFFRSINFFLLIWLTVLITQYAKLAGMNLGIVFSILTLSIVLQTIIFALFFDEKLTLKITSGMLIIIVGIVLISIDKKPQGNLDNNQEKEANASRDQLVYQFYAIILAIVTSCLNASRGIQAKYLFRKTGYTPVQFSIDASITCGLIQLIACSYFYLTGHPSYTMKNFWIMYINSAMLQLCSLFSLHAVVKGLAAPAGAIIDAHSLFTLILVVIFFGVIPSMLQFIGLFLILGGAIFIILFK